MFLRSVKGLRFWKPTYFLKRAARSLCPHVLTSGPEAAVKPCVPASSARFTRPWLSQSLPGRDSGSRPWGSASASSCSPQNPHRGSANDVVSTFASWPPGLSVICNLKSPGSRAWTEMNTHTVVALAHGGVRGVEPRAVETLPVPQYLQGISSRSPCGCPSPFIKRLRAMHTVGPLHPRIRNGTSVY